MSDLMRKEFEAWAKFHEIYGDDGERFPMCWLSGCYYENVQTQAAWEAWQASREFLVIELSVPYAVIGDYADCGGGRILVRAENTDRMCKKTPVYDKTILEAAGLKVKS